MNQSESLTWPAVVALAKTVTRRDWSERTRAWYRKGRVFDAYDAAVFRGGRLIARCRCTEDAYLEPIGDMPDGDWAGEGFMWMHENPLAIPVKAREHIWSLQDCSMKAFRRWRQRDAEKVVTVCRFQVIHVEDSAVERLKNILASKGRLTA